MKYTKYIFLKILIKNEPITKDTLIGVMQYRTVTGSCDRGVRAWMGERNIPYTIENEGTASERTVEVNKIKASELLPILRKTNAYGIEKFEKLITF